MTWGSRLNPIPSPFTVADSPITGTSRGTITYSTPSLRELLLAALLLPNLLERISSLRRDSKVPSVTIKAGAMYLGASRLFPTSHYASCVRTPKAKLVGKRICGLHAGYSPCWLCLRLSGVPDRFHECHVRYCSNTQTHTLFLLVVIHLAYPVHLPSSTHT